MLVMGGGLMDRLGGLMRAGLTFDKVAAFDPPKMLERLHQQSLDTLFVFLPFFGLMVVAAIVSSMLLSGWLFTAQALEADFGRLDPLKGIKRIVSWHGLIEMVKAVIKSALIGGVAIWVIWHNTDAMLALATESFSQAAVHLASLVGWTFLAIAGSMALIVAIDVPFQLWSHAHQLRMTKEELRQEAKESEGDPQIKARIRMMQREMARKRMMGEVPKADVIVTNPTHYAVALRYQDKAMRAPKVVAKGAGLLAARIREIGEENRIPILEAPPLARALFRHAELDQEIPAKLYTAVAEVLAYVYQLRHYRTAGGAMPQAPKELPVPPELDPEAKAA